jgi:hypothetical protein
MVGTIAKMVKAAKVCPAMCFRAVIQLIDSF